MSHGRSLYYGQTGSRAAQLWSCCLQPEPPFYVLLILFPRLCQSVHSIQNCNQRRRSCKQHLCTARRGVCPLVSGNIANLVMEYIEERAISTAAHPPRWWYRYVDDSHACLKKDYVQEFHDHLNSVNPNIQFTKEVEQGNRLSFLDTTTTRVRGRIQVSVYRKPTHTDKYLDYNSHHPSQHKRSVVNTLLHRAQKIPSTNVERSRERKHVIKVLGDNNYPLSFIRSCKAYHTSSRRDPITNASSSASASSVSPFVVLPYVRGVSDKLSRVLRL